MDWKTVLDNVTAFGTLGAVFVALYISGKASRKADAEAKARAGLVAARHLPDLESVQEGALILLRAIDEKGEFLTVNADFVAFNLPPEWEVTMQSISTDTLAQMLPLPNFAANRIARSIATLLAVHTELLTYHEQSRWDALGEKKRIEKMASWRADVEIAHGTLDIAIRCCIKAAAAYTPLPTAKEFRGEG